MMSETVLKQLRDVQQYLNDLRVAQRQGRSKNLEELLARIDEPFGHVTQAVEHLSQVSLSRRSPPPLPTRQPSVVPKVSPRYAEIKDAASDEDVSALHLATPFSDELERQRQVFKPQAAQPAKPALPERVPVNGTVGKAFECDLASLTRVERGSLVVSKPPAGLELSAESRLVGTPEVPGEHRFIWSSEHPRLSGELLLTINPDPRTLWKDIPSDTNDPYWKSDTDSSQLSSPVARVAVASVRGRSHAHVGAFRDDDFSMHVPTDDDPHGWHILCVADGAGSARSSRKGSELACRQMGQKLKELLVDEVDQTAQELNSRSSDAAEADKADSAFWSPRLYTVLATAARHAQSAVREEAESNNQPIKHYATTLLATIARRTRKGAWFVAAYWVGDGAIGVWKDGWLEPKLLGEPESGEYAGQTTFFTSEDLNRNDLVHKRLQYTIVESIDYLALMTDGISDPKFPTENLLKKAVSWQEFTSDLGSVLSAMRVGMVDSHIELLDWMQFWSPGNHDDRTLMLLVPREE